MLRLTYKPRTVHRDGYHPHATLAELLRCNGRDLLDVETASETRPFEERRRLADRYALMSDPETRATYLAFRARQRARAAA